MAEESARAKKEAKNLRVLGELINSYEFSLKLNIDIETQIASPMSETETKKKLSIVVSSIASAIDDVQSIEATVEYQGKSQSITGDRTVKV